MIGVGVWMKRNAERGVSFSELRKTWRSRNQHSRRQQAVGAEEGAEGGGEDFDRT
jgi:hypothetical protein